jgi:hypothetical protein
MKRKLVLAFCLLFAMAFAAAPSMADLVAPLDAFTASASNNGDLTSITYNGTATPAADLMTGNSVRYEEAGGDPMAAGGTYTAANADNLSLANLTTLGNNTTATILKTTFSESKSVFFILERGAGAGDTTHDAGTIWGLDISGNPIGTGTSYADSNYYHQTTYESQNRSVGGFAFVTDSPVYGVQIESIKGTPTGNDGLDPTNVLTTPIPGAVWLLGSGLIGLVAIRRRFKK